MDDNPGGVDEKESLRDLYGGDVFIYQGCNPGYWMTIPLGFIWW
jgi:hypothetical protein